jgi:hypothetical protein
LASAPVPSVVMPGVVTRSGKCTGGAIKRFIVYDDDSEDDTAPIFPAGSIAAEGVAPPRHAVGPVRLTRQRCNA